MTEEQINEMIETVAQHVYHHDVGFLVELADNDDEMITIGIGYTYEVASINGYHDEIWERVETINHEFTHPSVD